MNDLLYLDNETLLIILESFDDYFKAMRFVLSFSKTFYGSIQHMHLLKISTVYTKDVHGIERWQVDGRLHREDGPAIIYPNGDQYWYKNGKLHREDEPAIMYFRGKQSWYKNGQLHREGDQPAVISNNTHEWYKNGQLHRDEEYYLNGKKVGGPAIIYTNGNQYWYKNGIQYKCKRVAPLKGVTYK